MKVSKQLLSIALVLCLMLSCSVVIAGAVDNTLELTWNAALNSGNAPVDWVKNATGQEQQATIDAVNIAYQRQLDAGYNLGSIESFDCYSGFLNAQFGGGDNVGNPWGHAGRKWGMIGVPYPGIAFAVTGAFAAEGTAVKFVCPLSDAFTVADYTVQSTTSCTYFMGEDGQVHVDFAYPGFQASTAAKAAIQEFYATKAFQGENPGMAIGGAVEYNGGYIQAFYSDDNLLIVYSNGTETFIISEGNDLLDFDCPAAINMIQDATDISILLSAEDYETVDAVEINFTVLEDSTVSKEPGLWDLSQPVSFTITDADGNALTYTITAYNAGAVTQQQSVAASKATDALESLPASVSLYRPDYEAAVAALEDYNALDIVGRLLLESDRDIQELSDRLDTLGDGKIRITCVGDSITAGVGATTGYESSDPAYMSYPSQLQKILGTENYAVTNCGASGAFVAETYDDCWYPYLSSDAYLKSVESHPDIVIIMIGTNDASQNWYMGNNTAEEATVIFREAYERLIQTYLYLDTAPEIILATPLFSINSENREANNLAITIPVIQELAEEYGLTLLDMHEFTEDWTNDTYFSDGLHPNDSGYTLLAKEFATAVQAYVDIATTDAPTATGLYFSDVAVEDFDPNVTEYILQMPSYVEYFIPTVDGLRDTDKIITQWEYIGQDVLAHVQVQSALGGYGTTYHVLLQSGLLGDLNGDGHLSVTDVVLLRKAILSGEFDSIGDMNQDDTLSVTDVVLLRKEILNLG